MRCCYQYRRRRSHQGWGEKKATDHRSWRREQQHARVGSCVLRVKASPQRFPSATVWSVRGARAARLASPPSFRATPFKRKATFGATGARPTAVSRCVFSSVPFADRPCFGSPSANLTPSRWLSVASATRCFLRRRNRFTTSGATPGCHLWGEDAMHVRGLRPSDAEIATELPRQVAAV